jgi:hypothetical protein
MYFAVQVPIVQGVQTHAVRAIQFQASITSLVLRRQS